MDKEKIFHWMNFNETLYKRLRLSCGKDIKKYHKSFPKTTISVTIFWDFWMFQQRFLSLQVKQCAIITWYIRVASRVAERFKTYHLRKLENIRKVSKPRDDSLVSSLPDKMKILSLLSKNFWKTEIKMETRISGKYL